MVPYSWGDLPLDVPRTGCVRDGPRLEMLAHAAVKAVHWVVDMKLGFAVADQAVQKEEGLGCLLGPLFPVPLLFYLRACFPLHRNSWYR